MSCEDHLKDANKSLRELNKFYKSKGRTKQFNLLSKKEIKEVCSFPINKK